MKKVYMYIRLQKKKQSNLNVVSEQETKESSKINLMKESTKSCTNRI
jgi:hypothetical protein